MSTFSPELALRRDSPAPLVSRDRDRTVIWLGGEHDIMTVALLQDTLASVGSDDDADVVVDLRRVTFIDASTIGALLEGREALRLQSRRLTIRYPSKRCRRVLAICGLTELIEVAPASASPPTLPNVAQERAGE